MTDPRLWLIHIVESIERIRSYAGASSEAFFRESIVQDAVVRNLQVLAQSALSLPQEIRDRYADINWHAIRSFRNIVVHEYLGLDLDLTWLIVENDLPVLYLAVQEELRRLEESRG